MKKLILSLAAMMIIVMYAYSTIWTVSNHHDSPGQFTSVQDAVDAASAGDTIYISGSPTYYDEGTAIFVRKQLVLIGAGFNPGNQWNYPTKIGKITLQRELDASNNILSSPDGTEIIGISLTAPTYGNINGSDNYPLGCGIDNIKVYRCKVFSIQIYGDISDNSIGWTIKHCNVHLIDGHLYSQSTRIRNNFINHWGYGSASECIQNFDGNTLIINNIFLGYTDEAFKYVERCQISNNIFYGISTAGADYCTFNNNISYGSASWIFLYDHNTGANNQVNVDPMFVYVPGSGWYVFSYDNDYHLQPGSPAIGTGTNGTDIGIYGGAYPLPSGGDNPYETSPMPPIPQIIEMNVWNVDVPQNGTLQVNVKARKQD